MWCSGSGGGCGAPLTLRRRLEPEPAYDSPIMGSAAKLPASVQARRASRRRVFVSAAFCAVLAGCGGGIYLSWSDTGSNDAPPNVSLASSVSAASVGGTVRLIAAASDDFSVNRVEFYRIEPGGASTRLGSDGWPPYQWDTALPDSPSGRVSYYAVAIDDIGQTGSSATISVTVLR